MSCRQILKFFNEFQIYRIAGTYKTLLMQRKKYGPLPRNGTKDGVQHIVLHTRHTVVMLKD